MTKHLSPEAKAKKNAASKKHYHENKEYYKQWIRENVASRLCSVAKQRAKKRNIEFSITKEDLDLPEYCPVLGIKLEYNQDSGAGGKFNSYSLDRIDSSKGYIKGNVQVMSHQANSMKFTATKEELISFAKWVLKEYTE